MSEAMGPQSVFRFGKYRGLTVAAIARFNPLYLSWANENLDSVSFDDAAKAVIRPALRLEREQSMQRQNGWAWGFGREVRSAADSRRHRAIEIEHAERRKAGQSTCSCFPNHHQSCPECKGSGWVSALRSQATSQ